MWEVEFYETEKGDLPIVELLDSLDIKMRAKALKEIELLKELRPDDSRTIFKAYTRRHI